MIIVQIVERNKGKAQITHWQLRMPDTISVIDAVEYLSKTIVSMVRKLSIIQRTVQSLGKKKDE